jgi:hypothetical protein
VTGQTAADDPVDIEATQTRHADARPSTVEQAGQNRNHVADPRCVVAPVAVWCGDGGPARQPSAVRRRASTRTVVRHPSPHVTKETDAGCRVPDG